jgi:hypothetical protein
MSDIVLTINTSGSSLTITQPSSSSLTVSQLGVQGPTGPQGAQGTTGATGATGPAGLGVPSAGNTGQALIKASDDNYDTEWGDVAGSPGGLNTYIQFNDNGEFGATAWLTWNGNQLRVGDNLFTRLGATFTNEVNLQDYNEGGYAKISLEETSDVYFRNFEGDVASIHVQNVYLVRIYGNYANLSSLSPAQVVFTARGAASQTANLTEWHAHTGSVISSIRANGALKPAHIADTSAANDSLYYSTTLNKLVYKDSSGTVNPLY